MTSVSRLCFLCDCKLALTQEMILTLEMLSDLTMTLLYAILVHIYHLSTFLVILKVNVTPQNKQNKGFASYTIYTTHTVLTFE